MMEYRICRLSEAMKSDFQNWFLEADASRQASVLKMKHPLAQKQSLCADGLARKMLAKGIPASALVFQRNSYGKPEAVNSPLHFNLSHSGDFVLCATSADEIGADIEAMRPVSQKLISRVCTEEEKELVSNDARLFLQVWTAKEALAKFYGEGLRRDPRQFQVVRSGRLYIPELKLHSELTEEYALSIVYKT